MVYILYMSNAKKSEAYTKNRSIFIPETKVTKLKPEYDLVPLRGYSHIVAVFEPGDVCVGWMDISVTGYESVKDWIQKTGWTDQGY